MSTTSSAADPPQAAEIASPDASLAERAPTEHRGLTYPLGRTGPDYGADVARALALVPLLSEGWAGSLVEASLRFALASDAVSTVMVGCSSLEHLETAAAAINRGALPREALARLATLWQEAARAASR